MDLKNLTLKKRGRSLPCPFFLNIALIAPELAKVSRTKSPKDNAKIKVKFFIASLFFEGQKATENLIYEDLIEMVSDLSNQHHNTEIY